MFALTTALPHCPFPHWPTDSKETFVKFKSGWTVPQVKTTQWLLAQLICSSYHTFSLVPFCPTVSHSPCCGDTGSTKHVILCYVLFFLLAACSAWNAPDSAFSSQSCSAPLPLKSVSDFPRLNLLWLLYAITLLCLWGLFLSLSCLLDFEL